MPLPPPESTFTGEETIANQRRCDFDPLTFDVILVVHLQHMLDAVRAGDGIYKLVLGEFQLVNIPKFLMEIDQHFKNFTLPHIENISDDWRRFWAWNTPEFSFSTADSHGFDSLLFSIPIITIMPDGVSR